MIIRAGLFDRDTMKYCTCRQLIFNLVIRRADEKGIERGILLRFFPRRRRFSELFKHASARTARNLTSANNLHESQLNSDSFAEQSLAQIPLIDRELAEVDRRHNLLAEVDVKIRDVLALYDAAMQEASMQFQVFTSHRALIFQSVRFSSAAPAVAICAAADVALVRPDAAATAGICAAAVRRLSDPADVSELCRVS